MLHTDTSSYVTICNGDALVSQKKINMTSSLQIVAPWWEVYSTRQPWRQGDIRHKQRDLGI